MPAKTRKPKFTPFTIKRTVNTIGEACPICGPWLNHWKREVGRRGAVNCYGCGTAVATHGAFITWIGKPIIDGVQVKMIDESMKFILPLCDSCGRKRGEFDVLTERSVLPSHPHSNKKPSRRKKAASK
jgi:hypothetical protein